MKDHLMFIMLSVSLITLGYADVSIPFYDNMEYTNQSAFEGVWPAATFGTYPSLTLVTEQNHTSGGSKSVKSAGTGDYGPLCELVLSDTGTVTEITIEVWFYDAFTLNTSGGVITSSTNPVNGADTAEVGITLWTAGGDGYYSYTNGGPRASTGIYRTPGWHNVEFNFHPAGGSIYLDNNLIATGGSAMDETKVLYLGNPWTFAGTDPLYFDDVNITGLDVCYASGPSPADNSYAGTLSPILTWFPGSEACGNLEEHRIYLSTVESEVINETVTPHIVTDPCLTLNNLLDATEYFWKVNEVYDSYTEEGTVWSFTTEGQSFTAVAFYQMEGMDSDVLEDSIGANDMVLVDPNYVSSYSSVTAPLVGGGTSGSQSLVLNGAESAVSGYFLDSAVIPADRYVIEGYAKPFSNSSSWALITNIGDATSGMGVGVYEPGYYGFVLEDISWIDSGFRLDSYNWIHFALVGSETGSELIRFYINHELAASYSGEPIAPADFTSIGCILNNALGLNQEFSGLVDNIRFSTYTGDVNLSDLLPAAVWYDHCGQQGQVYDAMDFNQDCYVNLEDFAEFAAQWLLCRDPSDENCESWNGQ